MEDTINIIELKDVSKNFNSDDKNIVVFDDISYLFDRGSFNVILGESGSGKTTLLKLIGGLLRSSEGTVTYNGKNLSQLNFSALAELRRKHYGFIFQEAGLINHLTIGENISFPALKPRSNALENLAAYFGITHVLDKYPNTISLGEKQRASMARALFNEPEIIIADEPTANLDWANAKRSMELLKKYTERGVTVFVATHDERIEEYADKILYIKKGKIHERKP